ncbi:MAG: 3'-5' exonuclease [Fimbriiglobus sp.]
MHAPVFVAIDFETADYQPDSACAIGLVRVENGEITQRATLLLRPPRPRVKFTNIHGITWNMVAAAPTFGDAWPKLLPLLDGAGFLAAHNASFDRRVLTACCSAAGHPLPAVPFQCTVQVARKRWGLRPNDLASVCRRLGIGLIHHHAGSDAEACARIVLAARVPQPQ